jgi:hypothetical protein
MLGAMAQLFESIGIPFIYVKTTSARLEELCARGVAVPRADGGSMVTWTDPSGAIMVFNLNERRQVTCARPAFASGATMRIEPLGIVPDEECPHCDRVAANVIVGDMPPMGTLYMHVADMAISREAIRFRHASAVSVSLFSEKIRIWRDGEEFLASQSREPKFAPECLLLTGGFSRPAVAEVEMMATVLKVETRRNTATGVEFVWARVRTSDERELEVVASELQVPLGVRPGNVVDGTFWVVGQFVGR